MIEAAPPPSLSRFSAPADALAGIDAGAAGELIASVADVALVVDSEGVIIDAAFSDTDLAKAAYLDWIGKRWVDTVTVESGVKIEELLRDASQRSATRWRQVNHPNAVEGPDIPIRYRTIRFGPDKRVLAVGRDLRPLAALQQRLAEAQQAMEREYTRIRNAEKRYRMLFQLASEAVLIVDSGSGRVTEANPSAATLLGIEPRRLVGQAF